MNCHTQSWARSESQCIVEVSNQRFRSRHPSKTATSACQALLETALLDTCPLEAPASRPPGSKTTPLGSTRFDTALLETTLLDNCPLEAAASRPPGSTTGLSGAPASKPHHSKATAHQTRTGLSSNTARLLRMHLPSRRVARVRIQKVFSVPPSSLRGSPIMQCTVHGCAGGNSSVYVYMYIYISL